MEKSIITFSANEQNLQKTGGIGCYASDTVSYIEAHFALGENWSGLPNSGESQSEALIIMAGSQTKNSTRFLIVSIAQTIS